MNLEKYTEFLIEQKKTRRDLLQEKEKSEQILEELRKNFSNLEEVQDIFNIVGVLAQTEVKEVIQELVTEALQYVFGEEYVFVMENQVVRNQPETYFYVEINGVRNSLKDELGGGVLDVISFALRVIFWAVQIRRTRPILLLDEPLKNLDSDRLVLMGEMLQQISKRLGLQLIIITHEEDLAAIADSSYFVELKDGISFVEKLK